jgi:hypothetical protein
MGCKSEWEEWVDNEEHRREKEERTCVVWSMRGARERKNAWVGKNNDKNRGRQAEV